MARLTRLDRVSCVTWLGRLACVTRLDRLAGPVPTARPLLP
ncbi:hypothetical protein O7623_30390 [Solwaraspora sp. WMMD791]|nr:hypothetical protein [Solwaraspora sp. WMMD791]WFE27478.1 hypothetical protein O7623_30390 [Solwaraspora sp. WMMD791]